MGSYPKQYADFQDEFAKSFYFYCSNVTSYDATKNRLFVWDYDEVSNTGIWRKQGSLTELIKLLLRDFILEKLKLYQMLINNSNRGSYKNDLIQESVLMLTWYEQKVVPQFILEYIKQSKSNSL